EPTFGGVNLEDIKAPECFEIESRLKEELNIPVMHDDQHGTAIISGAALLNALEIQKKTIEKAKFVVAGAGADAVSCSRIDNALGAKKENIVMVDTRGVIRRDREVLDPIKEEFATKRKLHTLEDALKNADVFIELSRGGILSPALLNSMAKTPILVGRATTGPEVSDEL